MNKLKVILLLILWCMGWASLAQTRVHVFMNNGQQYRNVYLKTQETDHIIINLSQPEEDESLVRLEISKIRSIRYLKTTGKAEATMQPAREPFKPDFYYGMQVGAIVGKTNSNDDNMTTVMLKGMVGYEWKYYFGAGMGLGIDNYGDFTVMPVFAEVRGSLMDAAVTPFYYIQAGYSAAWMNESNINNFNVEEDIDARFMFNPGMGIRINMRKTDLVVSVGYKRQNAEITRVFEWGERTVEQRELNRITFGFGLIF